MSPIDSPRESCSSSPRSTIGVAAELGDADLEGDPRPGRGLLEDEARCCARRRDVASRAEPRVAGAPAFSSAARSSSLPSSKAPSSSPVRKSRLLQAADTTARGSSPPSPGTSSTGATSRPTRRCFTWRSRLLRITERNATHVQVNRDLLDEFAGDARRRRVGRGAAAGVPAALRRAAGRRPAAPRPTASLTSRNSLLGAAARARRATCNPDLIASGEGGSNLTLVRARRRAAERIAERRELAIHGGAPGAPGDGLHPHRLRRLRRQPARDQRRPGRLADGGRPARRPGARPSGPGTRRCSSAATSTCARRERPRLRAAARELRPRGADRRRGRSTTCSSRGLEVIEAPRQWPPERRELPERRPRACGLSDHAPVQARFDHACR